MILTHFKGNIAGVLSQIDVYDVGFGQQRENQFFLGCWRVPSGGSRILVRGAQF